MDRTVKMSRIMCIVIVMALILSIYASALYELQIVEGQDYLKRSTNAIAATKTVKAARGSILDRNGKLLVYDRTIYNIVMTRSVLMKTESPNTIILEMCKLCDENGINYTDTFPVGTIAPYSYFADITNTQRSRLDTYFEYFDMDRDTPASELIEWMRTHYGIDEKVSMDDARKIIGVRYEMECRLIDNYLPDYVFAEDVDATDISLIIDRNYPGIDIKIDSKREYATPYAAHLLGYVGKMNSEQYEQYKNKDGYNSATEIGKDGIEKTFEEYLHGSDGSTTITTDKLGNITGILAETPAKAGNNVFLTIDIDLQGVAEEALADTIEKINFERVEEEKAKGGAVVVRDIHSGDVLVSASYPTYELETFSENYSELIADPLQPIFNRATQGTYNPGSTFKMVTALAAFKDQKLTATREIKDESRFRKYDDFQPTCWVYPYSHGVINIVQAIEVSCNYFFYTLASEMGINQIESAAREFGFGQKTGIEITESAGTVASIAYKKEVLKENWWDADTLLTAIGQGHNKFTPIQIANYVAAIANGGTVYKATLLKAVKSADYSSTIVENRLGVISEVEDDGGYLDIIKTGMRAVAQTGTASDVFARYPIKVAAKTGTVQSDTSSSNTGVFVCYAPYDNPEIAISIVVEGGGSGSALMDVAKRIFDEYFDTQKHTAVIGGEYSLMR